jgi:hypothetical protein
MHNESRPFDFGLTTAPISSSAEAHDPQLDLPHLCEARRSTITVAIGNGGLLAPQPGFVSPNGGTPMIDHHLPAAAPDPLQPKSDNRPSESELQCLLPLPALPVPEQSLQLLVEAACGTSGGCQAARNFLFWLAGRTDPTGYIGHGGLEVRRLDRQLKTAALEVLRWWAGPTLNDRPLYAVLEKLRERFAPQPRDR